MENYNNILCILYLLAWVITFVWYHAKRMRLDAGSFIIGMQVLYAVFSCFSLNDPLFSAAYNPLKLFPYIYLFCMLLIATAPAIYTHIHPAEKIDDPKTKVVAFLSIVLFFTSLMQIPDIVSGASGGLMSIITDSGAGKEAYEEAVENAGESGSAIRNLPAVIYNALADFTPFIFFYYLTLKKPSKLLLSFLGITLMIGVLIPISSGQRGGTVTGILTIIGAYFMFRKYISRLANKIIQGVGLTLVLIVMIPVAIITTSRFEKEAAGVGGFVTWYIGQGSLYFNNYALDNGGIRYGDRTLNYFKRIVDSNTPKNLMERRDKYHNLEMGDNWFSTFVGDFVIDFGPYIPVIIFIVFNFLVLKGIRPRDGTVKLWQMLLLYFTVCVCIQGGMTLFSYSDSGNLRMIMFLLFGGYMWYHDILLEKYPLSVTGSVKQLSKSKE